MKRGTACMRGLKTPENKDVQSGGKAARKEIS